MNLPLTLFTLLSICALATLGNPLAENEISKDYIESIIQYWKKTRLTEHRGLSAEVQVDCNLNQTVLDEIHSYQDDVNQIIELFMNGEYRGVTFDLLAELTDTFGSRLTGSQALDDAIDWVVSKSSDQGFTVYTEDVMAPHWVRNEESLSMLYPRMQEMALLGLGSSIGTDAEGITAEVLVVNSFEDLQNRSLAEVLGKIVLYDVPFTTYGDTVTYRSNGAVEAAKMGAVASLVRSVTPFSIDSPHTGTQNYDADVTEIPSAAIAVEDATMIHRMQDRGEIVLLHLTMGAINYPDVLTRNTIIEIEGSDKPEEIVVVSGHLDSWDVGVGAMDDAGGCTISWMAGRAIQELNLTTRRTYRTVMFTSEEQGIYGGTAYFVAHGQDAANFQLMMESDFGTFYPRGIGFSGSDEATCIMEEILSLTSLIDTTELVTPAETPDLEAFGLVGVPRGSLNSDSDNYFWFHHSNGDRLDINDPDTMDRVAALWASVSYVVADVSFRLPHELPINFEEN